MAIIAVMPVLMECRHSSQAFAVTLLIGIGVTVYTAYYVSKLLFELYMDKVEGQELSI